MTKPHSPTVATFAFYPESGWTVDTFPDLDSEQTLVLVFADPDMAAQEEIFTELKQAYPLANLMGCSSAGEILEDSLSELSLVVAVIRFEHTKLRLVDAEVKTPQESFKVAVDLAKGLDAPDLKGVLVLSDGINVNGSELVKGLRDSLGADVVITGGLAGDKTRFSKTWVLQDAKPTTHLVTALGFYGDRIRIGYGSRGGWDIFGIERRVSKSVGNVLYEIDNKPALELYKTYLGELAADLPASGLLFPLGIRADVADQNRVVRTILAVDEKEQSMTFAGDIPEGSWVQLMKANPERLIDGASRSANRAGGHIDSANILSIAISCIGRRLVLGQRSEEEFEACLDHLPKAAKQVGFYSYGEISPFDNGYCDLHNQTMTLTVLYEQ